jgi:hypothetical protein
VHRTTVNVPDDIFQEARIKALREKVAVGQVIRDLLARWVAGEVEISSREGSQDRLIALARSARAMWAGRDPDAYLAAGRAGLTERDEELAHAQLDA